MKMQYSRLRQITCCFTCLQNDGGNTDLLNYKAVVKLNKDVNRVIHVVSITIITSGDNSQAYVTWKL